ncbi:MAG: hypothetical protein KCHDKBKB_01370 [Elusimicrobia bacterium]|nr:hypothetical protein [Elusimicrobiota bacterium]
MNNIETFAKLLQLSLSPIALISGAGLLLLSITNRLGRSIDRARSMALELKNDDHQNLQAKEQLRILVRRSELLRNSVFFTASSVFLSTLIILGLLVRLFFGWACEGFVLAFLFLGVVCLCVAMVYFLLDVSLSLKALKVNLDPHL